MSKDKKPKIMIIGSGGTIASIQTDQGFKPGLTPKNLMAFIPEIADYCSFETQQVLNLDSSNLQPEDWITIAKSILPSINRNDIDGVVVTHGTDTMSFTASAVALLLRNLGKPIVFTGSQIPLTEFGSDARRNLIDSIRVASSTNIAESVITFNSRVYRACRSIKLREYDLSAFETVDPFPIAEIGREINLIDPFVKSRTNSKSWFDGPINENVALVKAFPGLSPKLISRLPEFGYEGVVIEGYGAGNLPIIKRSLLDPIKELTDSGIPVVITTQCVFGRTELLLYETGKTVSNSGAISGHDMISEVALIKLMWALGKSKDMDQISALMHTNLAGEINPLIQNQ